ncbi:MAG: DNA-binding response regulator [endosymbiont of Galathealinum brachiosum]|uniref:DNA-binding response regulator n=1 Tax=endosymbiont of Galathealinum brachiosum TaxID=2200906 RepID=A0A370DN70_9GAMM|nr:MAG: DNA-binding response regulator [endosymbiont of Galathealinum brachiosum]
MLIADDHTILRSGIRLLLDNEPNFQVIGEADNGKDAILLAGQLEPDLLLSDLSMPKTNGTEAIHRIKNRYPNIKVLVLTVHKTEEHVHAALKAGADGYLLKNDTSEELINGINSILSGKSYLSPSICNEVVTGYLSDNIKESPTSSIDLLTTRELEVMKLIAEGYRNKDTAEYLSISLKTVEKHRSNLMKKLDLHSASSITRYAIRNGVAVE